jgi:drug/metabolite transporter (DMT)-like permease
MKHLKGNFMLLLAAFFWGTTFVAQSSAADVIPAFTFNASRSFVGAVFLALAIYVKSKGQKAKVETKKTEEKPPHSIWICGMICGAILFASVNLQQSGITAYPDGVASSGRSGFLTATYVVMVALVARFTGKKLHKIIYAAVVVCLIGMYFLCMSGGFSAIYFGDILTLACAVCFTGHILVVDHFSYCDSMKLSCLQFVTCGILSTIAALLFENPDMGQVMAGIVPILYAGILSSGIAYTLQMEGQKYAEPAVASILMSLESVFAVLGGWIVLNEHLTNREMLGCIFVFAAVIMAQIPQMRKPSFRKRELENEF